MSFNVCFYKSIPRKRVSYIYPGLIFLIIVNHAPPPESYFSLLSIVNRRSSPHPPEVGARYSLYVKCMLQDIVLKNTDVIPAGLTDMARHY